MSARRPSVLLITGYSRSGSTLLARLLGKVDGFVSPGELRYLWQRGIVENRRCDCGAPCLRCEFWREVLIMAFGSAPPAALGEVVDLQRRVDRVHRIPGLMRLDGRLPGDVAMYLRYWERLYQAIGEVSGERFIVDSSKDPSFGHILALSDELDLSVIHLVRDSRAVAYSWTREKHDPGTGKAMARQHPLQSALEWDIAEWAARRLTRRVTPSVTLRYEDFATDPGISLKKVLDLVGVTAEPPLDGNRAHLDSGHAVSGNPMRFENGVVSIRNDDQWQAELPRMSRALVTAATWAGLSAHGYLRERAA